MSKTSDGLQHNRAELLKRAEQLGVEHPEKLRRGALLFAILEKEGERTGTTYGRGVLEVHGEGFGFLRSPADNYLPGPSNIYVSQSQIRRFKLKTGDTVIGIVRPPKEGERYLALLRIESVNGDPPGLEPPAFETLTAIYPDDHIDPGSDPVLRCLDWVAPLGLGARGLMVAPARTGRDDVLARLLDTLTQDDELEVTLLLIDERPEAIQEWRERTTAEVIATPFDEPASRHLQVADIVFERARRMVERGDDVVVVIDSINRLLRAAMADFAPTGRAIGGVDGACLHRLRRYVGSARALSEGGSLTVLAVSSSDSTRADEVLLEDLAEVVNWRLTLSRDLADRGVVPAIDVHASHALRPERLLEPDAHEARQQWRRSCSGDPLEDGAALIAQLSDTRRLDKVAQAGN